MNSPGKGNGSEMDDGGNRAEGPGQGRARPHQVKWVQDGQCFTAASGPGKATAAEKLNSEEHVIEICKSQTLRNKGHVAKKITVGKFSSSG